MKEIKKCLYCGKEFENNRSKTKLYCSRKCYLKNYYKKKRKPDVTINCLYCGKEITFHQVGKDRKYCSDKCRSQDYRKNINPEKCKSNDRKNYRKMFKTNKLARYKDIKYSAKKRNYKFNLTFEQFETFWNKPCYYCGKPIEGVGIDRYDNTKGYELDNCVPCCKVCNRAKSDLLISDFFSQIQKIYNKHTLEINSLVLDA